MLLTESLSPSHQRVVNVAHRSRQRSVVAVATSSYVALLTSPLSGLAGNTPERADVTSIAILGYN
ncbi:hypothetical protein [Paraburkholderia sp.]|uniref:hypothetical protein n=1 Tax=Paraburkholderia sp. TaxID=1926495 RepID=UPI003D6DB67A